MFFNQALDCADRLDIWQLCSLISGRPCGDDSFSYFRRWLVLQGEEVFKAVLTNPDEVASFAVDQGQIPREPFIETAGSVEDIPPGNWQQGQTTMRAPAARTWSWKDSSEERIRRELPRLWQLVGTSFTWAEHDEFSESAGSGCEVEGLGLIRVGDRLFHKAGLGVGTVIAILIPETAVGELEFASGKKTLRISPAFFERVS